MDPTADNDAPEYYEVDLSRDPKALNDCTMDAVTELQTLLQRYKNPTVDYLYEKHKDDQNWLNLRIRAHDLVSTRFQHDYSRCKQKIKTLENLLACSTDLEASSHLYVLVKAHITCKLFQKVGIIFYFIEKNPQHPSALRLQTSIEEETNTKITQLMRATQLLPYQPSDMVLRFSPFFSSRLSTPSPAHTSSPVPMTNIPASKQY